MARETRAGRRISDALLDAEMDAHLDGEPESDNRRNGHNRKRVLTDDSALDLKVPRDRAGRFEPQLVEKYARRLPGVCGLPTRGRMYKSN